MNKFLTRRWILPILLAGLLLVTAACKAEQTSSPVVLTNPPPLATRTPQPLTDQALVNLEVQGIYEQAVKLSAGEFIGPPFVEGGASRPSLALQTQALGDLDQDGVADAALILAENSGGSGTFIYLAAVLNEEGLPVNTSTILLGDRVRVQSLQVLDGRIVVMALTHAPDDPLCCPTQLVEMTYLLDAGQLAPLKNK
jgi:hypothetical protein